MLYKAILSILSEIESGFSMKVFEEVFEADTDYKAVVHAYSLEEGRKCLDDVFEVDEAHNKIRIFF